MCRNEPSRREKQYFFSFLLTVLSAAVFIVSRPKLLCTTCRSQPVPPHISKPWHVPQPSQRPPCAASALCPCFYSRASIPGVADRLYDTRIMMFATRYVSLQTFCSLIWVVSSVPTSENPGVQHSPVYCSSIVWGQFGTYRTH